MAMFGEGALTAIILSSCDYPGDKIQSDDVLLMGTAPLPYTSGYIAHSTEDVLVSVLFHPEEAENGFSTESRMVLRKDGSWH